MLPRSRTKYTSIWFIAGLIALPPVTILAIALEQTSNVALGAQPISVPRAAILHGRVTDELNAPLADVRVRVAIPATDMRVVHVSTRHKVLEARSDSSGAYRLELPGISGRTTVAIDALKPGFIRHSWRAGAAPGRVEIGPGEQVSAALVLKPALYVSGIVVDERGRPIPAVHIVANLVSPRSYRGVEETASNSDGSFEVFNYPVRHAGQVSTAKGTVTFVHPDYVESQIQDVYAMTPEKRTGLKLVLSTGFKLAGMVLDATGKPVSKALVKAIRKDGTHRKATMTDEKGRFALGGLSSGLMVFSAHAMHIRQKLDQPMAVNTDRMDLEIRLKPIVWPAGQPRYEVLGMQLADVTPELQSAYDLSSVRGVFILDPGRRIDRVAEGKSLFSVNNKRVSSVREFIAQILAQTADRDAEVCSVVVRYNFSTVDMDGSTGQVLRLTKDDRKQLQAVLDQLTPESP